MGCVGTVRLLLSMAVIMPMMLDAYVQIIIIVINTCKVAAATRVSDPNGVYLGCLPGASEGHSGERRQRNCG